MTENIVLIYSKDDIENISPDLLLNHIKFYLKKIYNMKFQIE